MKIISAIFAFSFCVSAFASAVQLKSGSNELVQSGEVAAVDVLSATADASVSLKSVDEVFDFTNELKTVMTPYDVYTVSCTNYPFTVYTVTTTNAVGTETSHALTNDLSWTAWTNVKPPVVTNAVAGVASTVTVTNRFNWGDAIWRAYDAKVSHSMSRVVSTNVVATGRLMPSASYVVTNDIATVTCSGHHGFATPTNKFLVGRGKVIVTGAKNHDKITVIVK